MNNGDEAVYPICINEIKENICTGEVIRSSFDDVQFGLTKREHFAAMAMQGILSNPSYYGQSCDESIAFAVQCADSLLAELSNTNKGE